ncbi:restriction endonuclease subunit S [Escherichia albertii]|uniref:restriction endonuclease subunit S n=1 Tax=Escherichia albertii TaxID=208962 RepID=UPI00107D8AE0|nr:restriction endonuclease subunit S [Escherichia albertii]EFA6624490.1 restriction endonuclease subunit S [Escherichia albertii]EFA7086493.1 restriction endonuclease subunit S [Escherichia albertii]EFF0833110.1 restriction endonuclease subunit S [Escherichia albertii]EFF1429751.1 restriction endonuclease subunit S [Escherichia albertii]EFL5786950.1 restriction endonuclease subunit S [Escherichia albertii]
MVDLMVNEQRSSTAGKDVPAGYKLTEVGVIPEDWDCVPFGNLFKTNTKKKKVSDYELVSFIGMQDVSEDAQLKNNTQLPFKEVKSGFTYFEKGDVLLAKITPCFENGKGCHTADLPTNVGFGSTEFHVLRENEDSDSRFIYFWTTDKKFRASLESEMVGSAGHRRVPLVAIEKYLIPCPPNLQEQSAIADSLSDINNFILALEKLIVKKQAIKTATMQRLLTGKTRLPQFALRKDGSAKGYKKSELGAIPEDWVVTSIGQFTDCCAGGTPSTKISAYWGGTHPWMSSGELHLKQVYAVADYITDEGLVNSSTKYVPKNSVLVGLAGQGKTRGTVAINRIELCTNQSIAAIFPSKHHSTEFLFYNLDSRYEELRSLSTGDGGRGGLNLTIIRKLHLAFPPKEEQTAIATILSDMDKEIQTLQQRLDKTRQLKQGMMQELLTGKTRLI